MEQKLIKKGNFNWKIIEKDGRTEIELHKNTCYNYPSDDMFDLEKANLNLVRLILSELQLYSYEIRKKEPSKALVSFVEDES